MQALQHGCIRGQQWSALYLQCLHSLVFNPSIVPEVSFSIAVTLSVGDSVGP